MTVCPNSAKYMLVVLSKDGTHKSFRVHRLVAEAFITKHNSDQKEVNHKDGNKQNNNVSNLEWITPKENLLHALKTGLMNNEVIVQLSANKIILNIYHSAREASRKTGIDNSRITKATNKKYGFTKAGGYIWIKGSELYGMKLEGAILEENNEE